MVQGFNDDYRNWINSIYNVDYYSCIKRWRSMDLIRIIFILDIWESNIYYWIDDSHIALNVWYK